MKEMKHVVRFTYKPFVRLFLIKNFVFKVYVMVNWISSKTKCDLLSLETIVEKWMHLSQRNIFNPRNVPLKQGSFDHFKTDDNLNFI
jgi:hypothetical protein